jgi:hypothetical protein
MQQDNKIIEIEFLNRSDLTLQNVEKIKFLSENLWDISMDELQKLTEK